MKEHCIIQANCFEYLRDKAISDNIHLIFLDPPFNQNKKYEFYNDNIVLLG
jgi:16S rRNA G966 N2-methylase RsmD